jgi:hypothetical protein
LYCQHMIRKDRLTNIRSAVLLLALFVPWEQFLHARPGSPGALWESLRETLPKRVLAVANNIHLLHKSAEDAKKDAQLWASRSEGDQGPEFEGAEERYTPGEAWGPTEADQQSTLHDALYELHSGDSIAQGSHGLGMLLQALNNARDSMLGQDDSSRAEKTLHQTQITMPKANLKATKAAQTRLHKERLMAIEGDEECVDSVSAGANTGFGDDNLSGYQQAVPARVWVDVAPTDSFTRAGETIGKQRTLNQKQMVAMGIICKALDDEESGGGQQLLQYIGGGGGTGKSWLIDTLKEVLAAKGVANQIVVTATSGSAAAGIGGNTIHSATGIQWKDNDGSLEQGYEPPNLERSKQRWRRRKVLVIDEASMLGLNTLYTIDKALKKLRGFPEEPFGGIPVVILTGDFLQFGPVNQPSLLADVERLTAAQVEKRRGEKNLQQRWERAQAKELWQRFTSVVLLDEQKRAQGDPYLLGFLERLRAGTQTPEDAARLQARYDPVAKIDLSGGRRAIIPLNKHRWDLTLHSALAYGEETGHKVSLYLSQHTWKDRTPTEDERRAAMMLGDEGKVPVPGMFPYVEGMPVIVNKNEYMGLKIANGAEFTAAGIVHPPGQREHIINDRLSIFLSPPSGIILRSKATEDLVFAGIPEGTLLLPTINTPLLDKHAKVLCPHLSAQQGFKIGVTRTGLPCTPGMALTDYKAQGRTLGKVLLGLYGRKQARNGQGLERCDAVSMYVQLSRVRHFEDIRLIAPLNAAHFLEARMPIELTHGINRLEAIDKRTVHRYRAAYDTKRV